MIRFAANALAAVWIVALSASAAMVCAAQPETAEELMARLPARSQEEARDIFAGILFLGPEGLDAACAGLGGSDSARDLASKYAISGLVKHVKSPGAEWRRKALVEAMLKALEAAKDKEAKAFLIGELQLAGGEECVEPLARYLGDERLCDPAARALTAIGSHEAGRALAGALASGEDWNRPALLNALAALRYESAAEAIRAQAASPNADVRWAALRAMADLGDPAIEALLEPLTRVDSSLERARAIDAWLAYALRIRDFGKLERCKAICESLIRERTGAGETHVQTAARAVLVDAFGAAALDSLLEAMESPHAETRGGALRLARDIADSEATRRWVAAMSAARPEARAEIARMLGERGDTVALPALLAAIGDTEPEVRLAAIEASARLGGEEALDALYAALAKPASAEEAKAAQAAILRIPGPAVADRALRALEGAGEEAQAALLSILAARRAGAAAASAFALAESPNADLRAAALKALPDLAGPEDAEKALELLMRSGDDAGRKAARGAFLAAAAARANEGSGATSLVLARLDAAGSAETQAALVALLPQTGGPKAFAALLESMRSAETPIREAAVRALAEWPGAEAAEPLIALAETEADTRLQALALRGYIGQIETDPTEAAAKLPILQRALAASRRAEEKKSIMAAAGAIGSLALLPAVVPQLSQQDARDEALQALLQIARPAIENGKPLDRDLAQALKEALPRIEDAETRRKADDYIAAVAADSSPGAPDGGEEGFRSLFNGKDLSGWIGAVDGYTVEDGAIVCLESKGGNLFTEQEFSDFVLRFEFKLTPGANNGLGIRAPLGGDAAYQGIESQILDDTAEKYANLKPYQFHGSIYGVVPAKRGFLKPVGEWNRQEIEARGSRIKVTLNGEVIVDADVRAAAQPQAMDGKAHPGLLRDSGHIGFLGHGSRVEFRNIRIKELLRRMPCPKPMRKRGIAASAFGALERRATGKGAEDEIRIGLLVAGCAQGGGPGEYRARLCRESARTGIRRDRASADASSADGPAG